VGGVEVPFLREETQSAGVAGGVEEGGERVDEDFGDELAGELSEGGEAHFVVCVVRIAVDMLCMANLGVKEEDKNDRKDGKERKEDG